MKWFNLRHPEETGTLLQAARRSIGRDGGLFMPLNWPRWDDLEELLTLPSPELWRECFTRLLGDEMESDAIAALISSSFSFPVPLVQVSEEVWSLELFHGPTLAFKDFGARFLARVLGLSRPPGDTKPLSILTATSGDTGAAVAQAFHQVPGIRVVVLYPQGRVSPLQERLFATLGDNILALRVAGSFDDCQALVKQCFQDRPLCERLGLTSANSINPARLVAQIAYYLSGVAEWRRRTGRRDAPAISVPCGNFGNLTAGILAGRLGLPVSRFIVATNANDVVPEFLGGRSYQPRPSRVTLANAMDVGDPNNWTRIRALFNNDDEALRRSLISGSLDNDGIRLALRDLRSLGYQADPHGAVAWRVLEHHRKPGEHGLFLETAHPAKFAEVIQEAQGEAIPLPAALKKTLSLPMLAEDLPFSLAHLQNRLERFCQGGSAAGNISPTGTT